MYYHRLAESFEEIHKNWGWFLALGIALTVLGFTALGAVFWTTLTSVVLVGWLVFFSGAFEAISSVWSRKWSGFLMNLFAGILYMVIGGIIIGNPAASAAVVTILLATLFLTGGLFRIVSAATIRYPRWGLAVFDGVVTMALGALIWAQWPSSALWVIGTFIAINLICRGWSWMMFAFAAHRLPSAEEYEKPAKREQVKTHL